jgi:two-component sensor histidine kinase
VKQQTSFAIIIISLISFTLLLISVSIYVFNQVPIDEFMAYPERYGLWILIAKWQDVVSEGGISVLSGIWILLANLITVDKKIRRLLFLGFSLIFIGNLTDVLGEFYPVWEVLDIFENIGILSGMVLVTRGLYLWVSSLRDLNQELEARVSERTRELEAALEAKSVLLRELHHRIKNNLQIVSSFLRLQATESTNAEVSQELEKARTRIYTMASIHNYMLDIESTESLDAKELFSDLTVSILSALNSESVDLELSTDIAQIEINSQDAVLWGIILNELITNAVRHGFKGRKKGHLKVRFSPHSEGMILSVQDDGHGLDESVHLELGDRILKAVVYQLGAEITVENMHPGLLVSVQKMEKPPMR